MKRKAVVCTGLIAMTLLGCSQSHNSLSTETTQAFEWFDSLGYPSFTERKLVRVTTGWWSQRDDDSPVNREILAFLLEEDGSQFTVLRLNLTELTFQKSPETTAKHERVDFEILYLEQGARDHLSSAKAAAKEDDDWPRRWGEMLAERAELFVLARACHAAGHTGLANDLIDHAKTLREDSRGGPVPNGPLQEVLAQDFSHADMWAAVLHFGQPKTSRPELLERFRKITERFPNSPHAERAHETAELLKSMVKEDEAHKAAQRKAPAEMTTEERVAELIFQLRDQNGAQISQPGSCNIFMDPRGEQSPAHQLVKLGFDAVPQLIEALDAIARGAAAAKRPWTRTYLVEAAAQLEGEAPVPFLRQEMKDAPALPTRVAAAEALLGRKSPDAIPAMIAEWKKFDGKRLRRTSETDLDDLDYEKGGAARLILFLANCGDPAAVTALATGYDERALASRIGIVSAFEAGGHFTAFGFGPASPIKPGDEGKPMNLEVRQAAEKLLIGALDDLEEREGSGGTWNGKTFSDPRVCDIAGHVLNARWPEKYAFDLSASLAGRDRQRIAAINLWRAEQNLPPLPVPPRKTVPRVPDETTKPLLRAIFEAKDESERNLAVQAYENLGLGALPALNEALAANPAEDATSVLAARLACIVNEIEFAQRDSAKPDEALTERLEALRGKSLTSAAFLGVILETARQLPAGAEGIKLKAHRHGDGSGITLTVALPT